MLEVGNVVLMPQTGLVVTVKEQLAVSDSDASIVWRCTDEYGRKGYALREVWSERLSDIEAQVNVLLQLGSLSCDRIPEVIDFSIEHDSLQFKGLILMPLLKGSNLAKVLQNSGKNLSYHSRLEMAQSLLTQLTPCMQSIDNMVLHRNLVAQNILVDFNGGDAGQFSIVGFSSAVHKSLWVNYKWRDMSVAGDCRYWPAVSWRMYEGYRQTSFGQYLEKLDIHALGLIVLEILGTGAMDHLTVDEYELVQAWRAYINWANQVHQSSACSNPVPSLNIYLGRIRAALQPLKSLHVVYHVLERMLCFDEKCCVCDWDFVVSKMEESTAEPVILPNQFFSQPVTAVSSALDLKKQLSPATTGYAQVRNYY